MDALNRTDAALLTGGASLEEIFIAPTGVPLALTFAQQAFADDIAAGGPLKERGMAHLWGLHVPHYRSVNRAGNFGDFAMKLSEESVPFKQACVLWSKRYARTIMA